MVSGSWRREREQNGEPDNAGADADADADAGAEAAMVRGSCPPRIHEASLFRLVDRRPAHATKAKQTESCRRAANIARALVDGVVGAEQPRSETLAPFAADAMPDRATCVARELMKLHEEIARGPLRDLAAPRAAR